jgi:hypothetical protein
MNWTEIEAKWAAMARRVRADRPADDDDMVITIATSSRPLQDTVEMQAPKPLDSPAA